MAYIRRLDALSRVLSFERSVTAGRSLDRFYIAEGQPVIQLLSPSYSLIPMLGPFGMVSTTPPLPERHFPIHTLFSVLIRTTSSRTSTPSHASLSSHARHCTKSNLTPPPQPQKSQPQNRCPLLLSGRDTAVWSSLRIRPPVSGLARCFARARWLRDSAFVRFPLFRSRFRWRWCLGQTCSA